jgi:hypothetical protein
MRPRASQRYHLRCLHPISLADVVVEHLSGDAEFPRKCRFALPAISGTANFCRLIARLFKRTARVLCRRLGNGDSYPLALSRIKARSP